MTIEQESTGYWLVHHDGHTWELADEEDARDLIRYLEGV